MFIWRIAAEPGLTYLGLPAIKDLEKGISTYGGETDESSFLGRPFQSTKMKPQRGFVLSSAATAGKREVLLGEERGGVIMWQKDGKGNWFMAGQEPIGCCGDSQGAWCKTESGDWFLDLPAPQAVVVAFPTARGLSVAL